MIEAHALCVGYGRTPILDDVSFLAGPGELLAVVGPNGAGKSTLLKTLAGQRPPLCGQVRLAGRAIETMRPAERARHVTLVDVEVAADEEVTVRDAVAEGRLAHRPWWRWSGLPGDDAIVEAALARTALRAFADRPLATLSSGERQRVWIALALAQQAPVLLFDEPTSHLDLRNAGESLNLLRDLADDGACVVVVLHDLTLAAAYADRIAVVARGRLMACDVPEAVMNEALLSAAYDAPIVVRTEPDGTIVAAARPPRRRSPAVAKRRRP